MNWTDNNLGTFGFFGDYYIPGGGGIGVGAVGAGAGYEQIKTKQKNIAPRVVKTDKYDYPRLQKFFDWDQFLDWVDWSGKEWRRASQLSNMKQSDWTMTASFRDAMNLARYGWSGGLKRLERLMQSDLPTRETIKQTYELQTRYDVAGGAVNIGRYLAGLPDCMRRMHVSNAHCLPSRVQKIFINGIAHRDISTDEILKRGYMIYRLIESMEMANIQTEITIAFPVSKTNMYHEEDYDVYETYIKIKDATDIIYPEKLLFCLAHPSMLRRLVFSEFERNSYWVRDKFHFYGLRNGYGRAVENWLPSRNLIGDALVITDLENSNTIPQITERIKKMIQSQYEQMR